VVRTRSIRGTLYAAGARHERPDRPTTATATVIYFSRGFREVERFKKYPQAIGTGEAKPCPESDVSRIFSE
jgi:hypothetical protein